MPLDKAPHWVGYFDDHHTRLAYEFRERYPDYEIECWRPYGYGIDQVHQKEVNGVLHRVFPAEQYYIRFYGKVIKSPALIEAAEDLVKIKEEFLIHFQASHSHFGHTFINHFAKRNFPIIHQQGSSALRIFHYQRASWLSKFKIWWFYIHWQQLRSIRNSDFYHSGSMYEVKYLKRKGFTNVHYLKDGVEFTGLEKASPKVKSAFRKELGFDDDEKIAISVGKFTNTYSAGEFADFIRHYKAHRPDARIVMIGGRKTDEHYNKCLDAGATMVERVTYDVLKKYIQAADVNISQSFNSMFIDFAGIGTANVQALGYGIPLISNQLQHIPAPEEEMKGIGRPMRNYGEFEEHLDFMFDQPEHFANCAQLAEKYFNIEHTLDILHEHMKKAMQAYYG